MIILEIFLRNNCVFFYQFHWHDRVDILTTAWHRMGSRGEERAGGAWWSSLQLWEESERVWWSLMERRHFSPDWLPPPPHSGKQPGHQTNIRRRNEEDKEEVRDILIMILNTNFYKYKLKIPTTLLIMYVFSTIICNNCDKYYKCINIVIDRSPNCLLVWLLVGNAGPR